MQLGPTHRHCLGEDRRLTSVTRGRCYWAVSSGRWKQLRWSSQRSNMPEKRLHERYGKPAAYIEDAVRLTDLRPKSKWG